MRASEGDARAGAVDGAAGEESAERTGEERENGLKDGLRQSLPIDIDLHS